MSNFENSFKKWSEEKFCIDGKQIVPLSSSDVGFMKDAFKGGIEVDRKRIEAARNLFDSITCLCVEGIEVCKRDAIIMKISQEALKGYKLLK
jgi:hypothetical protein